MRRAPPTKYGLNACYSLERKFGTFGVALARVTCNWCIHSASPRSMPPPPPSRSYTSSLVKGRYAGSCLPSVFKGDFHSGL